MSPRRGQPHDHAFDTETLDEKAERLRAAAAAADDSGARQSYRQASISSLLDRAGRVGLRSSEAELLRQQVQAEQRVATLNEAAIERVRARCQSVRDRVGPGGMINASQVLGLLSPTWPDGNHEVPLSTDTT